MLGEVLDEEARVEDGNLSGELEQAPVAADEDRLSACGQSDQIVVVWIGRSFRALLQRIGLARPLQSSRRGRC
jgi:hypothetical protein